MKDYGIFAFCISIGLRHHNLFENRKVRDVGGENRVLFKKCEYSKGKLDNNDMYDVIIDTSASPEDIQREFKQIRCGGLLVVITDPSKVLHDIISPNIFTEFMYVTKEGKVEFYGIKRNEEDTI
jgi:hypothetical protein